VASLLATVGTLVLIKPIFQTWPAVVGASMLAMDVNDNAGSLMTRSVFKTIASMLAPTEEGSGT
jgi:hypothetical protein